VFRNLDNQTDQNDRHHVSVMQRVLGVEGEEEHFARLEVERARKVAAGRKAKLLAEERERDRALHLMKCPKCGMQLQEIAFGDVRVDKCFSCDGLWLDKGELDLIREKDGGFMGRLLSVFGADAPRV
jgi:excinuclease UvrABC ATPase subunit